MKSGVPIIDISPLLQKDLPVCDSEAFDRAVAAIGSACQNVGFFQIVHHGVDAAVERRLEAASAQFFALPREIKREIAMEHAGAAWRGYFEVGEELTSGRVDEKEGLYFAREQLEEVEPPRPLHGPNQWPRSDVGGSNLRTAVIEYMSAMERVSRALLGAIALSLGLSRTHFDADYAEPTTLFRCFNYPLHDAAYGSEAYAVGKHSDYGYLTVLKQDSAGGLEVELEGDEGWIDVPPTPGAFVVNIGDALEHATGGLLRATPHRVRQRPAAGTPGAARNRLSWPFFFDPGFEAPMRSVLDLLAPALREKAAARRARAPARWDGARLGDFARGVPTYGSYLLRKVGRVFPDLAEKAALGGPAEKS